MNDRTLLKRTLKSGALLAALAVILGAFAAHGLKERIGAYELQVFETAVRYHIIHALGMLLIAALSARLSPSKAIWAFYCFAAGIVLFSGSLYLLSTSMLWHGETLRWMGMITPLGGLLFIAGWLILAFSITSQPVQHR